MHCVDCGTLFEQAGGRGRPRVRCSQCSPEQKQPPGTYVKPRGTYKKLPSRGAACAQCSGEFVATYPHARFCSDTCRIAHGNRRTQEAARDRGPRPCKCCGVKFAPAYGDLRSVFCSDACARRAQARRTTGSTHRRRAKRFGRVYQPVDRIAVFERDGWRCKLCGIATPREKLGTREHDAPELDHVVPLSRGGDHTYENTQCACHDCNLFKGDRTKAEFAEALAA